jgi:hypothetical protein
MGVAYDKPLCTHAACTRIATLAEPPESKKSPNCRQCSVGGNSQFGLCIITWLFSSLLPSWWHIRTTATRQPSRHAEALTQRVTRVNRLADIHRIRAHLDDQCNLANHVARVGADHAATQDLAVALCFR